MNMRDKQIYNQEVDLNKKVNHNPFCVVILGNGFDLGLGLKTSYKDFANSKYWPFCSNKKWEPRSLAYFLNEKKNEPNSWFDVEELLATYAKSKKRSSKEQAKRDYEEFCLLAKALGAYLQEQEDIFCTNMSENMHAKRATSAHLFLQNFIDKDVNIYSFNYTNTYRLANTIILNFQHNICHIHGSLKENNIILGTGDQQDFHPSCFRFYKSANPNYKSTSLVEDLMQADEVYIFGHSLGRNDHDYFYDFFQKCIKAQHTAEDKKVKIRIFTWDEESEIEIKRQLRVLTDKHLIGLYAKTDLEILKISQIEDEQRLLYGNF